MPGKIHLRVGQHGDSSAVSALHRAAFGQEDEAILVDRLRLTNAFIPELSLVAEEEGRIVGHILLTRGRIETDAGDVEALALAPMGVLPERQRQGIGSRLVGSAMAEATRLGHRLAIVLGHPEYYPRFGFVPASRFGIAPPFRVADEVFMALWLREGVARPLNGVMRYAEPFDNL